MQACALLDDVGLLLRIEPLSAETEEPSSFLGPAKPVERGVRAPEGRRSGSVFAAEEVTALLRAWGDGDEAALSRLIPLVYEELRRLARRSLASERADHTLQPTALVHEAYLRLALGSAPPWADRIHFFAVAAQVMRRLLVDHARARCAGKRGEGAPHLPLELALQEVAVRQAGEGGAEPVDLLALDEALTALAQCDRRKARGVELHYFGGLTLAETARVLGVSTPTVILDLRLARAWLFRQMARGARWGEGAEP
jgi:RNA polymerase sigma factor (TIGR02999 family)